MRDSDSVFGHYVGHDEPSVLFYSNKNGSGNQMQYSGTLPVEPSATNVPGKHVYTFQYAAGILVRHGDVRHAVLPGARELVRSR